MNFLDRPVWASLLHASHLAVGGELAKRYQRDVNLFAATGDEDVASLVALQELVREGESVFLAQVPTICVPDGLQLERAAQAVQMIATRPIAPIVDGDSVVELGDVLTGIAVRPNVVLRINGQPETHARKAAAGEAGRDGGERRAVRGEL